MYGKRKNIGLPDRKLVASDSPSWASPQLSPAASTSTCISGHILDLDLGILSGTHPTLHWAERATSSSPSPPPPTTVHSTPRHIARPLNSRTFCREGAKADSTRRFLRHCDFHQSISSLSSLLLHIISHILYCTYKLCYVYTICNTLFLYIIVFQ